MDLPIPASAHDLRQRAGVIAVGLVGHRLHRLVGLPRLDAGRRLAFSVQSIVKQGRQRARFQADPLKRQAGPFSASHNACGSLNALASFTIRPVSWTMQIEVSSKDMSSPAKVLHGCSFQNVCGAHIDHVFTFRQEQPPSSGSVETPIIPSVLKFKDERFGG